MFSQSVNYKVSEDDPDTKNLFIALNVFDINAYYANTSLGINAYANSMIGKRFQADIDFRKAYSDDGNGVFAPKDLTKNFQFRIGGQFNLMSKIVNSKAKVVLSSYTAGNFTHTTYIMVPAKFRRILAARGGVQYFYNNVATDNGAQNTRVGNDDDMKAKLNGKVDYLVDPTNFETINYTVNTFGMYAGISYKSIVNVLINADDWGKKGTSRNNDFYFDALFCPLVSYTIKPNERQAYLKDADINIPENSPKYLGWRFGWQMFMGKKVLFTVKAEAGQQPGNKSDTFFMNMGLGIGFGTKILSFDKIK
jgi:hypothetical protein